MAEKNILTKESSQVDNINSVYYSIFTKGMHFKKYYTEIISPNKLANKLPLQWWQAYYKSITEHLVCSYNDLQELSQIECLKKNFITTSIFAYSLLLRSAFFDIALIFRNRAKSDSLNLKNDCIFKNQHAFAYHIAALHEKERYNDAKILIDKSKKNKLMRENYYLKEENIREIFDKNTKRFNYFDNEFKDYISNKSIAVVSPAVNCPDDGAEIDSFDLVIKCNFRSSVYSNLDLKKGKRCDISYYNTITSTFLSLDKETLSEELDWAVFKKDCFLPKHRALDTRTKYRLSTYYDYIFFNGHLNAIPNLLLDLLFNSGKKIKLFHVDFMTSTKRVKDYNPVNTNDTNKMALIDFCHHDPFTQISLLRRLYNSGLINVDTKLRAILEKNDEQISSIYNSTYNNPLV